MNGPRKLVVQHRHGPRLGRLAALLLVAGLATSCESSTGPFGASHVEAWQADVPARFTFPPVGLEEFAMARKAPGSVELVIYIGADGSLERLGAERVEGFDEEALGELFQAIRNARFAPATLRGQPVASIKRIGFDIDPLAGRFVATAAQPGDMR